MKRKEIYNCNNCNGKVFYGKPFGWMHVKSTGCIKPAVNKEDWKLFLSRNQARQHQLKNHKEVLNENP